MNSGLTEDRVLQLIDAMSADECTLRKAALILGKTYPTVASYRKRGHIRAIKKGGQWIVSKVELRRFHMFGNYDPNSPTLYDSAFNFHDSHGPLPIVISDKGVDLSALTPEERDRLGTPLNPIKPKTEV